MSKPRNQAIPAVYLILKNGNEILLMRRQGSGYYDDWYSVPAGHVEAGELPLDALIRETKEEIGITIEKPDARLVHTMYRTKHDDTADRADLFFEVTKWSDEIVNAEPHKCTEIKWFPLNAFPENTMHHVRSAITAAGKGILYSEFDLESVPRNPAGSGT